MRAIRSLVVVVALVGGLSVASGAAETSDQKMQTAQSRVAKMKGTLQAALGKLEAAKGQNDILKVSCINDQLSAIKGLLKISEESVDALKEAIGRKDEELIEHQVTKVSIAASRVEGFGVEVEACMGEAGKYTGDTVSEALIDPDIRTDDPSDVDADSDFTQPDDILESGPEGAVRPPNVSGSQ